MYSIKVYCIEVLEITTNTFATFKSFIAAHVNKQRVHYQTKETNTIITILHYKTLPIQPDESGELGWLHAVVLRPPPLGAVKSAS